jgi:Mg-chelatase subunit ChlD
MNGIRILAGLLVAACVLSAGRVAAEEQHAKPRIEVVFVLDTTSSMTNLIEAAKQKIWAIANTLTMTDPAPDIKMGLIGYRDRGDAYITKRTDLTLDLDAIHTELMGFAAQGGGDTPESVNEALNEAVTEMGWSADDAVYRVIFLVGDSPPHMDYDDDVKYADTCKLAAGAGIIINTIQCGTNANTTPIWEEIAKRAEGRAFRVEQSGNAVLASTPFDAKLTELSKELDATRVYYGDEKDRALQATRETREEKIYKDADEEALARRAVFNASISGAFNFAGLNELINDLAEGRVKLDEVKTEQLPESMQTMTPEERAEHVKQLADKRAELQKQIGDLAKQRQAFIEEQVRADAGDKETLDKVIYESVQEQAAKKGIDYDDGPAY